MRQEGCGGTLSKNGRGVLLSPDQRQVSVGVEKQAPGWGWSSEWRAGLVFWKLWDEEEEGAAGRGRGKRKGKAEERGGEGEEER